MPRGKKKYYLCYMGKRLDSDDKLYHHFMTEDGDIRIWGGVFKNISIGYYYEAEKNGKNFTMSKAPNADYDRDRHKEADKWTLAHEVDTAIVRDRNLARKNSKLDITKYSVTELIEMASHNVSDYRAAHKFASYLANAIVKEGIKLKKKKAKK